MAVAAAAAATVGSTHSKHLRQLLRSIAPTMIRGAVGGSSSPRFIGLIWVKKGPSSSWGAWGARKVNGLKRPDEEDTSLRDIGRYFLSWCILHAKTMY